MKKNFKIVRARKKWLKKKNLTVRKFAEATGNDTGTAYPWFRTGRTPRRKYLDSIDNMFTDFPVAGRA